MAHATRFMKQFKTCTVCNCGGPADTYVAAMLVSPIGCPNHALCPSCAKQWHESCIQRNILPSCPVCRTVVTKWVRIPIKMRECYYTTNHQKRSAAMFKERLRAIFKKKIIDSSRGWTRSMVNSAIKLQMVAIGFASRTVGEPA